MNIFSFLLLSLVLSVIAPHDCQAAFVQYRDENGKIHYVNTDYTKVPERYRGQVEEQLKAIEEDDGDDVYIEAPELEIPKNIPVPTDSPVVQNPIVIHTAPAGPITDFNRQSRLTEAITQLQTLGFYPPGFTINTGIVGYTDRKGNKTLITPATLDSVPKEYLAQIDSQILTLESSAKVIWEQKAPSLQNSVEVFTKSDCPDCVRLLRLLQVHKIPYLNYDIENSSTGKEFYKTAGGDKLPITRIQGQLIHGVEVGAIKKALNLK